MAFHHVILGSAIAVAGGLPAAAAPHDQAGSPSAPVPAVRVGDRAPDFKLPYLVAKPDGGFDQREVSLAEFRGRQNVVLAFFPAAFSPG